MSAFFRGNGALTHRANVTKMLECPHCNSLAVPAWERYARPHRLRCRSCGELSRIGPAVHSLSGLLFGALVAFPIGMSLFVLAAAAIRVRAPHLIWPFLAVVAVAAVLFSGTGALRPYPVRQKKGRRDFQSAVESFRTSGVRVLGVLLLMALGFVIFVGMMRVLAPYVRAWIHG